MKNVYYYEVGYNSYEEAPIWTLSHEKKFTKKEFDNILLDASEEVFLKLQKQWNEELYKTDEEYLKEQEEYRKRDPNYLEHLMYDSFDNLYSDVVNLLIEKYGFEKLKISHSFIPFGWASVLIDDWENDTNKELVLLRKRLSKYDDRKKK